MHKDLNKCPACGALRTALSAQCPECGYDFHNSNCKVIEDLNRRLEEITDRNPVDVQRKQLDIIRSFAIPQIKEEILDLLIYIQPKATQKNSKVTAEWRLRQKEVIQRAKMAFATDKAVLAKVQAYEDELNKLNKQFVRQWWQKSSWITKTAIVVLVLLIALILIPAKDISPEAYAVRFTEALNDGNYDKALKCLNKSPEMGTLISDQYLSLVEALIDEGRITEAENLFSNGANYVDRTISATHLSDTCKKFVEYFLAQGNMDKASFYAADHKGMTLVLKALILSGDSDAAAKYFRSNYTKLTDYNQQRKRELISKDEVVEKFVMENNLMR